MFESIYQDPVRNLKAHYASMATSIIVHSALACALVLSPLFLFEGIQCQEIATFVFRLPETFNSLIPASPPARTARAPVTPVAEEKTVYRTHVSIEEMELPLRIPGAIPPPDEDSPFLRAASNLDAMPGIYGSGGTAFVSGEGLVPFLNYDPPSSLKMPAPPADLNAPLRIGVLNPAKLIFKVSPKYPILAHKMGVSGTVILEALIDEEGSVSSVKVVEGHPLLHNSSVTAVKQWKYTPTIQNGEPIKIIATIRVVYRLDR